MDKKIEPMETLAAHAMITLPDSRREATTLLECIISSLPRENETRVAAQTKLHLLRELDRAQAEFFACWEGKR